MKALMRKLSFLICLSVCVMCVGCSSGQSSSEQSEGVYFTYYVNADGTALVSRVYEAESQDITDLINELMRQCSTIPDESDGHRAIPVNVTMSDAPVLEDGVLSIYFDLSYIMMDSVTELLCKAALAKTFTQLDEIDYITLYVNGQPFAGLTNGAQVSDGSVNIGFITAAEPVLFSADDFVDNVADAVSRSSRMELVLYFADETGTALATETRYVAYSGAVSPEKMVMNELMSGPEGENLTATLPSSLKVQEIGVRDGVCYVDFNSAFLDEPTNVVDMVQLYSVVNSLTELPAVSSVQITVNGSPDELFHNNISLSGKFERNLNLMSEQTSG